MSSAARTLQISPLDGQNLLHPAPPHGELREEDPVHWSAALRGWLLSRHEDVLSGLRDSRLVASREDLHDVRLQGLSPELAGAFRETLAAHPWDGREAAALRWQSAPGFTPQALDTWRPAIRGLATRLVRRVGGQGRMDAVRAVCAPLPALVLAEVFDLPERDRESFIAWARHLADFHSPAEDADPEALGRAALQATREFLDMLAPLLEERYRTPEGDLLSRMLQVEQVGSRTAAQRVSTLALHLVSGLGSVADQLGNGLHELLAHPEQLRMLRLDRSRLRPAVEEALRFHPALPLLHRTVGETLSLRGRTLHKGEAVFLSVAAANRDPRVFTDPERFDVTRDSARQKHVTFGFGLHHRLDAGLIRHELETVLEVLLEELPGLRLDEERLPRLKCHDPRARGFEALPVRW
jgi:cytochrome P450